MQQTVQENNTLLIDGPASVQIVSGIAEVFGKQLKETQRVVIRKDKRKPFYAVENMVLNIMLGANATITEVEGNTIPQSWNKPIQIVKELEKKPRVIIVLGAADMGKSSFCAYLLNKLVVGDHRVAVVDGDLGQSDIGPAASVGYALTTKAVTELNNLRLQNGFFVGVTSPIDAIPKMIQGLTSMINEALQKEMDYIIVNTDGFIAGDVAVNYKLSLIKELKPDVVVGIQAKDELDQIMSYLGGGGVMVVEPSPALSARGPDKRKSLREMTYKKYLKKPKLQCIPISQLTIEPRNGIPKSQEPGKGILVGLYGYGTRFLGIGVLRAINTSRRTLKIQTSVSSKPIRLVLGKVVLNKKLDEV